MDLDVMLKEPKNTFEKLNISVSLRVNARMDERLALVTVQDVNISDILLGSAVTLASWGSFVSRPLVRETLGWTVTATVSAS